MTGRSWERSAELADREDATRIEAARVAANHRAAELEDIDLAKALSMTAKLCTILARDIALEKDDRDQSLEVAAVLEKAAQLVRGHARLAAARVIDAEPLPPERG